MSPAASGPPASQNCDIAATPAIAALLEPRSVRPSVSPAVDTYGFCPPQQARSTVTCRSSTSASSGSFSRLVAAVGDIQHDFPSEAEAPEIPLTDPLVGRVPLEPATAISDRRALMLMSIRNMGDREPLGQDIFDEVAIDIVEGRLRSGEDRKSTRLN